MDDLLRVSDCSECHGVRTVFFGICSICFAEFDEWHDRDSVRGEAADVGQKGW